MGAWIASLVPMLALISYEKRVLWNLNGRLFLRAKTFPMMERSEKLKSF